MQICFGVLELNITLSNYPKIDKLSITPKALYVEQNRCLIIIVNM